jgi:hypothetical protein
VDRDCGSGIAVEAHMIVMSRFSDCGHTGGHNHQGANSTYHGNPSYV